MADATPLAGTPTPNYNFNLPTVGGDDNVWGGLLNANWSNLDTLLWNVSGVANAALTQAAGDARYLQLTGGTLGPNALIVNGAAQFTGGATFGTTPVSFNSQVTFTGAAHAVTPTAGDNSQNVATTAFVASAIGALPAPPAPSNAAPIMDGTAAPGSSALYARGDHVHPSDASRLPLAGGTLTGALTLAADPSANLQAATKQYVDAGTAAIIGSGAGFGGFVNKLRNGGFDVWQRGTPVSAAVGVGQVAADGWIIGPSGAAVTVSMAGARGAGSPRASLSVAGAAGTTTFVVLQRIESWIAAPLCGQVCTFQCWIFNNTGASVTPTLTVSHPTAADNWTSTAIDVGPVNLQPCPPGVWTRCAYTFAASLAAQSLGLGCYITWPANLGANNVMFSEADLRATPGLTVGLNANPPPPELRPIGVEVPNCQRYFQVVAGILFAPAANVTNYGGAVQSLLTSRMRATPTAVLTTNTPGGSWSGSVVLTPISAVQLNASASSGQTVAGAYNSWTANLSAEL